MELQVSHITKDYRSPRGAVTALADASFTVAAGEFVCLVGPSGCGKSTLLRLVAGLLDADNGAITLRGWPRPHELSGGMRQRAAIARAFVTEPDILLMDEPLRALDAQMRLVVQEELLTLWQARRPMVLYVTHDIEEALLLADRVLVMSGQPGRIRAEIRPPARPDRTQSSRVRGVEVAHLGYIGATSETEASGDRSAARLIAERRAARSKGKERWLPTSVIVTALALWEVAARAGWISDIFFPPPSVILLTLGRLTVTGALWPALAATLYRLAAGVALGAGAGLLLGWLMGARRSLRVALNPIVAALHPMPKLAIFPIVLVLLGIGEGSKVAMVALTAFFPMLINTLAGVQQIDGAYWEAAINYGATGGALIRRVILPGSLPLALTGLRLAVNSALMVTVAVEMLSARQGLGATIWLVWQTLRTEELYATLIVIGLCGMLSNAMLTWITQRLVPWQTSEEIYEQKVG